MARPRRWSWSTSPAAPWPIGWRPMVRCRPRDAARLGAEIADGLYLAHSSGIVHRDVKPANILIGLDGRYRLVDFGIAHSLAAGAASLTATGTVIGTLRAMAPEQLRGEPVTPRTDLYGLGTVLYEALTGRPPFAATTPLRLAEAQAAGPPPLEGPPRALDAIVRSCLEPDPSDRPLHAGAVAAALRGWLAGDDTAELAMATPAAVDREAKTRVHAPIQPAAITPSGTHQPRRRWALPLLGLAGVVLAGLLLAMVLTPGRLGLDGLAAATPRSTDTSAATTSPSPSSTPVPTPTATPDFDLGALPPPVADEVERWWEACDTEGQPPPVDVAGMNKKDAEDALKPYREACGEDG